MRILRDIPPKSPPSVALAVGNFDGLHLGHRLLISNIVKYARQNNFSSAVMTFEPHPLQIISGQPVRRLSGIREKAQALAEMNVDFLFLLRFNKEFAKVTGEDFANMVFTQFNARYVAVGEDFRFGRKRGGNVELLRKTGEKYDAVVAGVPLQKSEESPISSGRIRECIRNGDFTGAAGLLGREWELSGKIVRGRGFGRELGYPTANLNLKFVPVCGGIYAGIAKVGGNIIPAAVSIGRNPTVGGEEMTTEAHLLDFAGDIYGSRIELRPYIKLREEKTFPDIEKLRLAIGEDVAQTRDWWESNKKDIRK